MTSYLTLTAVQRPFPVGRDENDRHTFSCNYEAEANGPVGDWEREVARLISDAGWGALGTDMLIGSAGTFTGPGPFVRLIDTGGSAALETHDEERLERLSIQVLVTAADYDAARERALGIWRTLDGRTNFTVAA